MADQSFQKLVLDGINSLNKKQDNIQKVVSELTTEFRLHKQESELRWDSIEKLDQEQNAILAEHRSTGLAQQEANKLARQELEAKIAEQQKRIDQLEEPRKFLMTLKSIALYVSAIAGAVLIILRIFNLW